MAIRAGLGFAGRIAFMTAGAFTVRAAEYLALSGWPKIAKPFDTQTLPRVVADLIDSPSACRDLVCLWLSRWGRWQEGIGSGDVPRTDRSGYI
jgi:hypothetical protein